jgi:uncharacterized protein (DUF2342 family)
MRLTNYIRDAFVTAAMQDVPKVDYEEQIRKAYVDAFIEAMPAEIQKAYKKHPEYFNHQYKYVHGVNSSFQVPHPNIGTVNIDPQREAAINLLAEKAKKQRTTRNELGDRLKGIAYGATTRKALLEALPEFEKYLPEDTPKACRSVPAIANLVSDFTKAGWPASKGAKA